MKLYYIYIYIVPIALGIVEMGSFTSLLDCFLNLLLNLFVFIFPTQRTSEWPVQPPWPVARTGRRHQAEPAEVFEGQRLSSRGALHDGLVAECGGAKMGKVSSDDTLW